MTEKLKTFKFEETEIKLLVHCLNRFIMYMAELFHDTKIEEGPAKVDYEMAQKIRGYLNSAL